MTAQLFHCRFHGGCWAIASAPNEDPGEATDGQGIPIEMARSGPCPCPEQFMLWLHSIHEILSTVWGRTLTHTFVAGEVWKYVPGKPAHRLVANQSAGGVL